MSDQRPDQEVYTLRDNPACEALHATRTAIQDAAFFLPYLRPGMDVLDVGCGPGGITVGLAGVVAPGKAVGVDFQTTQVEQARALAAERGVVNARFETGDAYQLPFPNGAFDAVFAHAVLMHLREPVRALAEMRRVLRPAGIAGVRDPDLEAVFLAPSSPLLEQRRELHIRVLRHNGGDPSVGRHYRRLLLEAGFSRAEASASVASGGSLEGTRRAAAFMRNRFQGFARTALAEGWIAQATVDAMVAEIDAWAERPDAFSAILWCEAIGWVEG